jgi:hypothetical protein
MRDDIYKTMLSILSLKMNFDTKKIMEIKFENEYNSYKW